MRAEIAKPCKEQYGMNYELGEITDCHGCRKKGGRLFLARQNCQVRSCAMQKGLENSAHRMGYACKRLEAIFAIEPTAIAGLDEKRRNVLNR